MEQFSIRVSISITSPEARESIQQAFIRSYQDIGANENPGEYLARKCEEYILGIYSKNSGDFMAESARALHLDEIGKAAIIRKRVDGDLSLPADAFEPQTEADKPEQ